MAYDCQPVANCPRVLQFSNPKIDLMGHPGVKSGTLDDDNARSLNMMAPVIAAYRTPNTAARLAGPDRFSTAAQISKHAFPTRPASGTVVIANGMSFADAASASPLAAKLGAPLLLTTDTVTPSPTKSEIARLKPSKIVVIGGKDSVSDSVIASLKSLTETRVSVSRIAGADRFETSLEIAKYGWGVSGTSSVFLATGRDFPDALSAGAAAGMSGVPLLLVNGLDTSASANLKAFLTSAKVSRVNIAGSASSVSIGIQNDVARGRTITRYTGKDRYETSAAIASEYSTPQGSVFIASGLNYPDGLTGSVAAGMQKAPLLLSVSQCIPQSVGRVIVTSSPSRRYVLEAADSLSEDVRRGKLCSH